MESEINKEKKKKTLISNKGDNSSPSENFDLQKTHDTSKVSFIDVSVNDCREN